MSNLDYSTEALAVRPEFFDGRVVLAVEDKDDGHFWGIIANWFGVRSKVKIESKFGVENVMKVLREHSSSNYFIARDRDYSFPLDDDGPDRILLTFGHSIENTLCHPIILSRCLASALRDLDFDDEQVFTWLDRSLSSIRSLVAVNLSRETEPPPLQDHPGRYLTNSGRSDCCTLCEEKVEAESEQYREILNVERVQEFLAEAEDDSLVVRRAIPGHFLLALCRNHFHKARGEGTSVQDFMDRLFEGLQTLLDQLLDEFDYYRGQVEKFSFN